MITFLFILFNKCNVLLNIIKIDINNYKTFNNSGIDEKAEIRSKPIFASFSDAFLPKNEN